MKKKSLSRVLLAILAVMIIYVLVWFINSRYVYQPFTANVPKHESGIYLYHDNQTNYTYNVKFPQFPGFTGNLGLSDNHGSGLIIWPGFFGSKYEYGVKVQEDDLIYDIKLDKNMNILDEDQKLKEVYENHKALISNMWEEAENIWQIDFSKK